MREIRPSGLEGGVAVIRHPYPYCPHPNNGVIEVAVWTVASMSRRMNISTGFR